MGARVGEVRKLEVAYETSDGQAFTYEETAKAHQHYLNNQKFIDSQSAEARREGVAVGCLAGICFGIIASVFVGMWLSL